MSRAGGGARIATWSSRSLPEPRGAARPGRGGRLATRDATTWIVLAPAIGLILLGVLLLVSPATGAAIFGLPAPEGLARGYLPALGIRDIVFGSYVLALAGFAGQRAVGIVLLVTVLIPAGDIALLLAERGLFGPESSPLHLLVHAASGAYVGCTGLWALSTAPDIESAED